MKHSDISDQSIVNGCVNEDRVFEKVLVEKYAALLMTVSRRYSRTYEEAEDVLQDAFVKIFESIHQFDENRGKLKNWMTSIVIRTALRDYKRKFPSEKNLRIDLVTNQTTQDNIIDKLSEEEILKLISQLPNGFKQVFNLYVIDGYSHKEIGQLLGISESTSRSQLARAKKMLRKTLSKFEIKQSWQKSAFTMISVLD